MYVRMAFAVPPLYLDVVRPTQQGTANQPSAQTKGLNSARMRVNAAVNITDDCVMRARSFSSISWGNNPGIDL